MREGNGLKIKGCTVFQKSVELLSDFSINYFFLHCERSAVHIPLIFVYASVSESV